VDGLRDVCRLGGFLEKKKRGIKEKKDSGSTESQGGMKLRGQLVSGQKKHVTVEGQKGGILEILRKGEEGKFTTAGDAYKKAQNLRRLCGAIRPEIA